MGEETPTSEETMKIKKENNTAHNFLIQSVMGTVFHYVKNANGHVCMVWTNLCK
jgi:hypothetical protein